MTIFVEFCQFSISAENIRTAAFALITLGNKLQFISKTIKILQADEPDKKIGCKEIYNLVKSQNNNKDVSGMSFGAVNAMFSLINSMHPETFKLFLEIDNMDWWIHRGLGMYNVI